MISLLTNRRTGVCSFLPFNNKLTCVRGDRVELVKVSAPSCELFYYQQPKTVKTIAEVERYMPIRFQLTSISDHSLLYMNQISIKLIPISTSALKRPRLPSVFFQAHQSAAALTLSICPCALLYALSQNKILRD